MRSTWAEDAALSDFRFAGLPLELQERVLELVWTNYVRLPQAPLDRAFASEEVGLRNARRMCLQLAPSPPVQAGHISQRRRRQFSKNRDMQTR
jgi:hypothetical protein